MSDTANLVVTAEQLSPDLAELVEAVETLPIEACERLKPIITRIVMRQVRRRRFEHYRREAVSQLRLDMKYLLFDLEATRKERDSLLKQDDDRRNWG